MRIISRLCHICQQWHNHLTCPFCGAMRIGNKHYDRLTGHELVRSHGLPRVLSSQVVPMMSVSELRERVIPRLVAGRM